MQSIFLFIQLRCKGFILLLLLSVIAADATAQISDSTLAPIISLDTQVSIKEAHTVPADTIPAISSTGPKPHLYRMNYWLSGGFTILASAANVYAIPNIIKAKKDLTVDELKGVSPNAVSPLDKVSLHQDYDKIDRYDMLSDYILQGIIASTVVMGFDKKVRKDGLRLFAMYAEMHSITFSIYNFSPLGPSFQNKLRPVVYYTGLPDEVRNEGNNRNSLYSGHTASAAASTFFMAKVYNDYHPELSTGTKYLLYGLAALPPLAEGYFRMKALKHFPSDILVGFIVGATTGIAVPEMHRYKKQAIRWGITATPVGPGLCAVWRPR